MNEDSFNRLFAIELSIILLSLFIHFTINSQNKIFSQDFLISMVFVLLLFSMFIFRSKSIRHMYLALLFILLTALADSLKLSNTALILSGIALDLLILGTINMILFKK